LNIGERLEAFKNDDEILEIYFKDYLPKRYFDNLTEAKSIITIRNICIILSILEIFSAIWGFSYYFIRRVFNNKN